MRLLFHSSVGSAVCLTELCLPRFPFGELAQPARHSPAGLRQQGQLPGPRHAAVF